MRSALRTLRVLVFGLAGLLLGQAGGGAVAWADQSDTRLAPLFDILKETKNPLEARLAEQQIWTIWMSSEDATASLLMHKGVEAMAAEDLKGALQIFSKLVEIAPDFAEGWNKRATVLFLLGAYPESIADIDRTLELEPRHFGALSGLGLCNTELDHDEAALDAFERALTVNPHMNGARANAEFLRRRIGDKAI